MGHARKFRPDNPEGNFNTKEPTQGDIVIDKPEAFFHSPVKNKDLQRIAGNLFLVLNAKDGKLQTQSISRSKPGFNFKPSDLVDITFYIPDQFRSPLGKPVTVWLYLPVGLPKYDYFKQRVEMLKKGITADPDQEAEMVNKMRSGLGMASDPAAIAGYVKLQRQIENMLKQNMDPTLELKRAFADDSDAKSPGFVKLLRTHNLNLLADYLEGKDIRRSQDKLGQAMQSKVAQMSQPKDGGDSLWNKFVQRQKQQDTAPKKDYDAIWNRAFQPS